MEVAFPIVATPSLGSVASRVFRGLNIRLTYYLSQCRERFGGDRRQFQSLLFAFHPSEGKLDVVVNFSKSRDDHLLNLCAMQLWHLPEGNFRVRCQYFSHRKEKLDVVVNLSKWRDDSLLNLCARAAVGRKCQRLLSVFQPSEGKLDVVVNFSKRRDDCLLNLCAMAGAGRTFQNLLSAFQLPEGKFMFCQSSRHNS